MRAGAGLRFECTQCGKCCVTRGEYAHVYVNADEERTLAQFLGMSRSAFRREYTFVDEDGWRQLTFTKTGCVFLSEAGQCTVYPARPVQCRTFPFWSELIREGEWTREARELCEGVGRGRLYTIDEARVPMREFEESEE